MDDRKGVGISSPLAPLAVIAMLALGLLASPASEARGTTRKMVAADGSQLVVSQSTCTSSKGKGSKCNPPANRAPVISGTPAGSVDVGQSYLFQPSASDPDGDPLAFAIVNRPPWASFDTATGRLSGTPAASLAGEHIGIVISVSDGKASSELPAFTILVVQPNRAPAISGNPPTTVREGQAYAFQPAAADADGDALSFSISNKPSWATFSTVTGALTGTPGPGAAGSYASIVIRVSDGKLATSLPAFTIVVEQASMGTATLSWQPPTTRSDGSPLANLAGYRIHYGTAPGNYTHVVNLPNPGLTTYVVENLAPATWYFVARAYDGAGLTSDHSAMVSKTIP